MKNLNSVAEDLFNKIRGRFPSVTIGDSEGTVTTVPQESRFYDFAFTTEGTKAGKVSISLDEENGVTVIVGKDIVENQPQSVKSKWFDFLRELRQFAKKRMLQFDVRDITKSNLQKRDYKHLAATRPGEETMAESKMYGTHKTSYQRIGNARLAIKHTAPINTESSTGRTQKIGSIFIESPSGEKFRYPFVHLSGARAMARHVSEGGNAYDDFGKYISGLSEELSKLRKFNTYMNRSGVMAETLGEYTSVVKERSATIRKEIQNLQKENYYREAVDGFSAPIVEEVPEDVAENWIDQLTIRQFNEELKDVFPYIYRLVGEATRAKTLGPEDLEEDNDPCWKNYKMVGTKKKGGKTVPNCVPEEVQLEAAFEAMMGQFSENPDEELDEISKKKLGAYIKGASHDLKLSGLDYMDAHRKGDDKESSKQVRRGRNRGVGIQKAVDRLSKESNYFDGDGDVEAAFDEAKQEILYNVKNFDEAVLKDLANPDYYEPEQIDDEISDLSYEMVNSFLEGRYDDSVINAISDQLYSYAKQLLLKKFKSVTQKENGQDLLNAEKPKTPLGEFILSYFDRETGKFPKGPTAVLTAVEKDYGDEYVEPARQFIEQVEATTLEYLQHEASQSRYPETEMIKRLAGM